MPQGDIAALLGISGIGKSTLLRIMTGLLSSSIEQSLPQKDIAYMPQHDLLFPWLNALDNTMIGYRLRNGMSKKIRLKAKELFVKVGLKGIEDKYPAILSGGMRKRIALIRALLEEKPLIVMDEPFSQVDSFTRFQLQDLIVHYAKHASIILVTHDIFEALRIADTIYILQGEPASLHLALKLSSKKPRALDHPDIILHQAELFNALKNSAKG